MTTLNDVRAIVKSIDNVNFKPSEDNILIRTEFKIATLIYKLSLGVSSQSDEPAGLINITRRVAKINDFDVNNKVGERVEINTKLEAIQGLRINLTKKTFTKFTDMFGDMLSGIEKSLDSEFPTFTVVTYDLMPTRLILGTYEEENKK